MFQRVAVAEEPVSSFSSSPQSSKIEPLRLIGKCVALSGQKQLTKRKSLYSLVKCVLTLDIATIKRAFLRTPTDERALSWNFLLATISGKSIE